MGIPIPKTLVIRASPSHITLAIWLRVRVTGDALITRVLGMGMPKTRGYPYHSAPFALVELAEKVAKPGGFSTVPRRRGVQLGDFVLCAKTSL